MNLYETVEHLLRSNPNFVGENDEILKTKVSEAVTNLDPYLVKIFKNNDLTRQVFFQQLEDVWVLNQEKLKWVVNAKEFLEDSYTSYTNEIGLTSAGKFLSANNDVVLDFPYKDAVLVGGQDKDDQKRQEIMYHEVIGYDQITNLKAPKVFANAKRYTVDGIEEGITFTDEDNLIIKGNNYAALNSLLERYQGKVKLIYIDPPYNTGTDSFNYNDNFNHSSWLIFMKNRLEIAKKLLTDDGVIFVHCDNNEQSYLKVLLDELFGDKQFIETITVVNNPRGRDYGGIANMHEFIHVYAKVKGEVDLNKIEDPDKNFPFKDEIGDYEVRELRNRNTAFHVGNRPNLCYPFYVNPENEVDNGFLELSLEPKAGFVEVMPAKSRGIQTVWRWGKPKSKENLNINIVGKAMKENGRYMIVEKYRDNTQMPRSVWWDKEVNSERGTVHLRELFGKKVFNFPKPEESLKRIIQIGSKRGDLILDFHLGSGTTAAVAHKMGRQYIGIEQMDYIEDITVERLKKVIDGEQGGISKAVDWQGGGSFVYCELLEDGQRLIDKIQSASSETIQSVKDEIYRSEQIVPYILTSDLEKADKDFNALTLDEQKQALIGLIDKNKLYVNYSSIDDEDYQISKADKKFSRSFYEGGRGS